jgi:glycosyltransferase involved in cell wall biosynthesis
VNGNPPLLSVLMTNYNYGQFVGEALEAILAQSYKRIEVIVIDDASTDNSVDVIQGIAGKDERVRVIVNDRNAGGLACINKIVSVARGEYYYSAASDDRVLPGFFEKSMTLLAQHPNAGLCCADPVYLDGEMRVLRQVSLHMGDRPCFFSPFEVPKLLQKRGMNIPGHTMVVKRSAIIEAGYFLSQLRWHCDWFAHFVIAFRYGMCYVPEPLAALRVHGGSYSAVGVKRRAMQRTVLDNLLSVLKEPQYQDVFEDFRRSGIWPVFNLPALWMMLSQPKYWSYLSPLLVRRMLWYGVRGELARLLPAPAKRFYRRFRRADYSVLLPGELPT